MAAEAVPELAPIDDDQPDTPRPAEIEAWGSCIAITKSNPFRTFWTSLVTLLLIYIGTIFIYRLCFIDFRIPPPSDEDSPPAAEASGQTAWDVFDTIVTIAFWVDLVTGFFFTFDDEAGNEIIDIRRIAKNYLQTYFLVNVVACIPEELIQLIILQFADSTSGENLNETARTLRLQRMNLQKISRMARLMRLGRLGKMKGAKSSHIWRWMQRQKGVRVINLSVGLTWIVHILACGWYLCACLHENPADTWVMRRSVDHTGKLLVESEPGDQWLNSMYFTLTVFTTVGFGDMSALTVGEIVYVCFMMGVGAVVHSIIMGEVINVVTSSDQVNVFVAKQRELIEAFSSHTELDENSETTLTHWVDTNARSWFSTKYDRDEMTELIMGDSLPRDLLGTLPAALFSGMLVQNRLLRVCDGICSTPPRLPLLLALAVHRSHFVAGEVIYAAQDYPFSMFLVLQGTFAFVAKVSTPRRHRHVSKAQAQHPDRSTSGGILNRALSGGPTRKAMSSDASMMQSGTSKDDKDALHPYVLFSKGSYFGESELTKGTKPRRTTARCESETGDMLTLNKADFKRIAEEFPQFGTKWAELAIRRDKHRTLKEAAMCVPRSYKHLAAKIIQDFARAATQRRGAVGLLGSAAETTTGIQRFHRDSPHVQPRGQKAGGDGGAAGGVGIDAEAIANFTRRQDDMCSRISDLNRNVTDISQRVDEMLNMLCKIVQPPGQGSRWYKL